MSWDQITPTLVALVIAILGYLISYLDNKKTKEKLQTIEQALQSDDTEFYIICPNCGAKICLNKLKIIAEKKKEDK